MALIAGILFLFLPQGSQPAAPVQLARVTEVIQYLAADDRLGRDTPSVGLDQSAEFLAKGFAAAGLKGGAADGTFFHVYTRPGQRLDSGRVQVTVWPVTKAPAAEGGEGPASRAGKDVRLLADTDVRLWSAASEFAGEDLEVLRVGVDQALERGLNRRVRGSKPTLLEVDPDSPLWRAAAGTREVLGRGRTAAGPGAAPVPPTLLVRKGALPPGDLHANVQLPAPEAVELKLRNVVAVLPGGARKDEYVMFSAHYDHIGVNLPVRGDAVNNGADDDASGTTAVLTLAEAFARTGKDAPLPRSLLFVCFSGEEKGLLGSRAFAETPPLPLDHVAVDFNLEMLGRPQPGKERCAWITGSDLSDFQDLVKPGLQRAGVTVIDFAMAGQLFGQSDNYSLAQKGVVAHSISAGSLHQDYHQPSDEVQKLDLPHMTAVINGIFAAGQDLARAEARPAWTEKGQRLGQPRRRG